jgi:hypothetical protein
MKKPSKGYTPPFEGLKVIHFGDLCFKESPFIVPGYRFNILKATFLILLQKFQTGLNLNAIFSNSV